MFVKSFVPCCDVTDRQYSGPVAGAIAVARGESGRYCAVMYFGPEYLEAQGIEPMTREEAIEKIELRGDGYVDF